MGVSFVVGHLVEVVTEPVEARGPHPPVRGEPVVQLGQGLGAEAVPPAGPVDSDGDEPCLAEDPEVLRGLGLGQPQGIGELADELLTGAETVEDRAPDRLGQDLERSGHLTNMP
jgi:hypothetical protein